MNRKDQMDEGRLCILQKIRFISSKLVFYHQGTVPLNELLQESEKEPM
ncbi:hypothetical protein [Bacillus salacetis]|nr:hypothetical protein [Bacillus salacetis]